MWQQRIEVRHEFPIPVNRLFAYLAEHENLAVIFAPAKIKRINDGKDSRNGVGSARELRMGVAPAFVETVTAYEENELIEYRITRGSPLKNHHGVMRFSKTADGGSRLDYSIVFEAKFPPLGPLIKMGLERGVRKGLDGLRL